MDKNTIKSFDKKEDYCPQLNSENKKVIFLYINLCLENIKRELQNKIYLSLFLL